MEMEPDEEKWKQRGSTTTLITKNNWGWRDAWRVSLALSLRVRTRLLDIQCSPNEGDTKEYHNTVMFAADTVCDNSTTNPDNNRSSDHGDR